jgi:hypothetical protein
MKPANRIRLARLRIKISGARARIARARIDAHTGWAAYKLSLKNNPNQRKILGLILLSGIAAKFSWFFAFYFLPTIIAITRQHKRLRLMFFCNLFLGWTPLWLLFFCYAFRDHDAYPSRGFGNGHRRVNNPVRTRAVVEWTTKPAPKAKRGVITI